MNLHPILANKRASFIYPLAVACIATSLTGCTSPGAGTSGSTRLQSNSENSRRDGVSSRQLSSEPASNNPVDKKRGNTPPGMDRAGSAPGSGAIIDPAGVITK
jgi:hypothetical protein